jgi:hypothetical protein
MDTIVEVVDIGIDVLKTTPVDTPPASEATTAITDLSPVS